MITVKIKGTDKSVDFEDDTAPEVIEKALAEYSSRSASTPTDVPVLPPEGSQYQDTPPKSFYGEMAQELPRMAGGIAGPLVGGKMVAQAGAKYGPKAAMGVSAGLASTGAAIGEIGEQLGEFIFGSEDAPTTPQESIKRVGDAALEYGLLDVVGGYVSKIAGKIKGFYEPEISAATHAMGQEFSKYGGVFTKGQLFPDSKLYQTLTGLIEKSFTGAPFFKMAAATNKKALVEMTDDLAETIVTGSSKRNRPHELGKLFVDSINEGRTAFKAASNKMYGALDDLVAQREVETFNVANKETGLVDIKGNPITRAVTETVTKLVDNAPVNMKTIKEAAKAKLGQIAREGEVATEGVMKDLNAIASRPDTMLFGDAAGLRSSLLSVTRAVEDKIGSEKAKASARTFSSLMTDAMDDAVKKTGSVELKEAYKTANKFYKQGKGIFNHKLLDKLLVRNKLTVSNIGSDLFSAGKYEEIWAARKAIRASAKLNPKIKYDEVWGQMQSGYLRDVLQTSKSGETELVNHTALFNLLEKPQTAKTLSAVFDKSQIASLKQFKGIVNRLQENPEHSLGMVMQLTQASALLGMATFDVVDPKTAIALTVGPAVLARMLTKPSNIKLLGKAMMTPSSSKLGAQVLTDVTAMVAKVTKEIQEDQDERSPQQGQQQ